MYFRNTSRWRFGAREKLTRCAREKLATGEAVR